VDAIAINQDSNAHVARKLAYLLLHRPDPGLIVSRWKNRKARTGMAETLDREFPAQRFNGAIHRVEHHLAHLSSAFHVSPFSDAVAVSVDGFGDFASGAWGAGHGAGISVDGRVFFPHSLGIFYQAITQFLGFPHYGDEYKVMGLAPYGRPAVTAQMRQIVRTHADGRYALELDYFRHHREHVPYRWND